MNGSIPRVYPLESEMTHLAENGAIHDLKERAGLEHELSRQCSANASWLACAALARHLVR